MAKKEIDFKEEFTKLLSLNVNEHTEKLSQGNSTLTYLSWTYAVAEATKADPDFEYDVLENKDELPYFYDELTGYMVKTTVTMFGKTKKMWLPVMDSSNHAMKSHPYEIQTKYKTIPVAAANMFDINKTIMRCLVKNIAMFGLGLYIFAGEDLPRDMQSEAELATMYMERLNTALKEADTIDSRAKMNEVWNKYPDLQRDGKFVAKFRELGTKYPKDAA